MPSRGREPTVLAKAACLQAACLLVATTWAFGGNADWVRPYLAAGGALGAAITFAAALAPEGCVAAARRWWALAPLALFNALALLGAAHPGFRPIRLGGQLYFMPRFVPAWRPSAALPGIVLPELGLFDGLYLSAFNLFLLVHRRRALRGVLLALVGNAAALAAFGTVQKLTHARGLYFGRVASPQSAFFSTFVYDNHWGAFIVLMAGAALGLAWHYAVRRSSRNFFHTPGFASLFAVLLMAVTVPLSGARVCSVLLLALAAEAVVRWLLRQRARKNRPAARRAILLALAAIACGLAAVGYVGQDVIPARIAATRRQVRTMLAERNIGSRSELYEDTWRMAEDRPWFGWGMGSYPWVFQLYN
ncbi:MAG: O-antigen ligase family protein, partial [Opitutaceae bacterium]